MAEDKPSGRQPTPEVMRLMDGLGALTTHLAESHNNEKLLADTQAFVTGQKTLLAETCTGCASRLRRDAVAEALRSEPIELRVQDRRSDFLLRMVVAFYQPGLIADRPPAGSLALPRHALGRLGNWLRDVLGSLPFSDLNHDCSRLVTRFPEAGDKGLRDALFAHEPSRLLLLKVLVRLLDAFRDIEPVKASFVLALSSQSWPHVFRATEAHFDALCDGLFGRFLVELQTPREGDDLESWFGTGATDRLLDLLEEVSAPVA